MKKRILSLFVMVSILVGMLSGVSFASATSYTYAGYVLDAKYNYNFDIGSWYITLKMITENGLVDTYTVDGINEAFGDMNPRVGATPTGLLKGTMVEYSLNDMYVIDSIDASKGTAVKMQALPTCPTPGDGFYYVSICYVASDYILAAPCGRSEKIEYTCASDVKVATIENDQYVGNEIITRDFSSSDKVTAENANAIIQGKDGKIVRIFSFADDKTIPTNISYELSADGVLTISGKGAIDDYTSSVKAPWGTTGIKKVVIEEGITSIGTRAFYGCTELEEVSIPSSIESIGIQTFCGCTALSGIVIPSGVKSIGVNAFGSCESLVSVVLSDGLESIGNRAFDDCIALEEVSIPDSVESIGEYAFSGCATLKSIEIPDSIDTIGKGAFASCTSLKSASLPDGMTEIPGYIFSGCEALEEVTIPASVTDIAGWAFSSCDNLKDIYYGGSKEQWEQISIGYRNNFYSVRINYAVSDELIASGACGENLTWVLSGDNVLTISGNGDMYDFSSTSDIPWYSVRDRIHSVVIEEGVTSIGKQAIYMCTNLDDIYIPEGVTKIGMGAFFYCTRLPEIVLPSTVKTIDESAFVYCMGMTAITIPRGVETIGENAFSGCSALTDIYYGGTKSEWDVLSAEISMPSATIHYIEDYSAEITSCSYTSSTLSVGISLKNATDSTPSGAKYYAALYNASGKLKAVTSGVFDLTAETGVTFTSYTYESGDYVKLMLLDADSKPMCVSDTANVE